MENTRRSGMSTSLQDPSVLVYPYHDIALSWVVATCLLVHGDNFPQSWWKVATPSVAAVMPMTMPMTPVGRAWGFLMAVCLAMGVTATFSALSSCTVCLWGWL